jgi:outer membrane biosynthesis protein TonB
MKTALLLILMGVLSVTGRIMLQAEEEPVAEGVVAEPAPEAPEPENAVTEVPTSILEVESEPTPEENVPLGLADVDYTPFPGQYEEPEPEPAYDPYTIPEALTTSAEAPAPAPSTALLGPAIAAAAAYAPVAILAP